MHKPPPYSELSTKNEGRIRHEEQKSYLVSILEALHVIKTGQWHLKNKIASHFMDDWSKLNLYRSKTIEFQDSPNPPSSMQFYLHRRSVSQIIFQKIHYQAN